MLFTIRTPEQRDAVIGFIRNRNMEKPYEVEIRSKRQRRSVPQNSLYWLYLTALAVDTGNDKDVLHEYFANRYLSKRVYTVFGREVVKRESTAGLDKKSFSEYIERVRLEMDEMGYPYPSPDHPLFEEFFSQYRSRIA